MLTKLYVRAQNMFVDDEGATAVEYGIMVAAIAAVIITVVFAIGTKVDTQFDKVDTVLGLHP